MKTYFNILLSFWLTIFAVTESLGQTSGTSCTDSYLLCDDFSHIYSFPGNPLSQTYWYSFYALDENLNLEINMAGLGNYVQGQQSLAEVGIALFGDYTLCDEPCDEIQVGNSPNFISANQIFTGSNPVVIDFELNLLEEGGSEIVQIDGSNLNISALTFPCVLYLAVTVTWQVVMPVVPFSANIGFRTENIACEWPTSQFENPYGLCANYYSLSPGTNQTASFPTDQNGLSEIWFSGISNGPSGLSLNVQNIIGQSGNSCILSEASLEVYGPIQVCDDPCSLIENLELSPSAVIPLTLSNGEFTYQPSGFGDGQYLFKLIYDADCEPCSLNLQYDLSNALPDWPAEDGFTSDCEDCLPSTFLVPNKSYVFSVWVKQDISGADPFEPWDQTYTEPTVALAFNSGATTIGPYNPTDADPSIGVYAGPIIEGWQLMEITFITPSTISDMNVELSAPDGPCFFDDIRLFPKDGSMKSYVYDPQNLRFVAELDERHFATLYEYDEEGRLMRIKKETERGIMTIQESKTSTVKR